MSGQHTANESDARAYPSLRFRLSFLFLLTFGASVLFALGRFLGVQFAFYMIGVIGLLAGPALMKRRRASPWIMMVAMLAAFAWFSGWIVLAGCVVRFSN